MCGRTSDDEADCFENRITCVVRVQKNSNWFKMGELHIIVY
jgi:hypothetical protein